MSYEIAAAMAVAHAIRPTPSDRCYEDRVTPTPRHANDVLRRKA
jgi:hypothetical protein